eukprot:TRINITY_DN15021_c0_g1_i1.p1 TRINITY_DN15021_c0_g1~~TRINITY_DN15021_c0_g1_i1.p1  ORF type:complete len:364 (-),score=71.88 TRINITY_DN15021_c0_g1_i1:1950-3041(-)
MSAASENEGVTRVYSIVKGYVDTPDGQIHYRRCGDGPPSLVLLHAAPSSSAMFSSALPRLAAWGVSCCALDVPNAGESFITPQELSVEAVANVMLGAVVNLGCTPQVTLVGHQAGASIAIQMATRAPKRVSKLVLWGVPLFSAMARGDLLREEAPDYGSDFMGIIQTFVKARFGEGEDEFPWQLKLRGVVEMLQTGDRRAWLSRPMAALDHEAALKRLKQPTLCLGGDSELLQKMTMKAALLLENGKYVNIGGAGSDIVDEYPEEYVRKIVEFVTSDVAAVLERTSYSASAVEKDRNAPRDVRRTSDQMDGRSARAAEAGVAQTREGAPPSSSVGSAGNAKGGSGWGKKSFLKSLARRTSRES